MRLTVALSDGAEYIQNSCDVDRPLEGFREFYTLDVMVTSSDRVAEYLSGLVSSSMVEASETLTTVG